MILLRWLASSPLRLVVGGLVAWGAVAGTAFPVAAWIRGESDSVVLDTVLQTTWLLALLLGALLLAIAVGDRLFPHRWRERVILGLPYTPPGASDDDIAPVILKSHVFGFSVLFVALLGIGALGLDLISGGFLGEYQRVGYMHSIRRGDNEAIKQELIGELARVRREQKTVDAVDVLALFWQDRTQPMAVRVDALDALGQQALALRASVREWSKAGVRDHWELTLLRQVRRQEGPLLRDLVAAPPAGEAALAGAAALVLGKLGDAPNLEALLARLRSSAPGADGAWRETVLALGVARDGEALGPMLDAPIPDGAEDFRALAWSIGEVSRHYIPETDAAIDALFPRLVETYTALAKGGTLDRRCEAVDVLRKTGDARIWKPLAAVFDTPDADGICPTAYVDIHEIAPELMVATEPLRMRIIRALALVALGNAELLDWLRVRQHDTRYTEFVQQKVREAVQLIEARQE